MKLVMKRSETVKIIRLGSRESKLAVAQANIAAALIKEHNKDILIELHKVRTKGDKLINQNLALVGGKGLFIKELEVMLYENKIDAAVHSLKDLPHEYDVDSDNILCLPREDARDVLIMKDSFEINEKNAKKALNMLPKNAVIGTSSLRRSYQLKSMREDIIINPIRGNIDTRLKKLYDGSYDAIILAKAGLNRLNLKESKYNSLFEIDDMIPAPGQGVIAVQTMTTNHNITAVSDLDTSDCALIEKLFAKALKSDCVTPVGAYAYKIKDKFILTTYYYDEKKRIEHRKKFMMDDKTDAVNKINDYVNSLRLEENE